MSDSGAKWTFAQQFYVDFNTAASELAARLDSLKSGPDAPLVTIQTMASDLSRLTKSLGDATGDLPSYDQRRCELQLKALERRIEEFRVTLADVPKFSFRRKVAKPKPSSKPALDVMPTPTQSQPIFVEPAKTLARFSHRYLTFLDVCSPNSSAEVSISELDSCIVNLLASNEAQTKITALYVQRVSRSVVLLPQVSGSIILHDLSECVLVFRMHNSTAVDIYLESGSDPIIEHCSAIQFAAYPTCLVRGGTLRQQDNQPLAVKDFSYILPTQSPNWSLLPEEQWEKSWPVFVLQDQDLRVELERILSARSQL